MNIEIKRLSPQLVDDYLHFFDVTPHSEKPDNDDCKCYCVWWCNANTKCDCYNCFCWCNFMGDVHKENPIQKIKSIFCFAIVPEMRGKGVHLEKCHTIR